MPDSQAIQQCIQQCQQTASQLRSMAQAEADPQVKMKLNEGAHHLDLCVVECQYSLQQLSAPGQK